MFHRRLSACLMWLGVMLSAHSSAGVQVQGDKIYVNGEEFLVKGLGYSSYRPHEAPPRTIIPLSRRREEFQIIRDAGFNTIRTWSPLNLEELNLAHEFGLYVIQGIWIEYRQNFTDPHNIQKILDYVTPTFLESSEAPNVILFLLGNEPQPAQVFSVGREAVDNFFIHLKDTITREVSHVNVSISNWVQADFLNDAMWDMAALNIYNYNPQTVSHAAGFRGYLDWMKRTRAVNRPFVITETGLSVSRDGPGNFGYGGNTLEQQEWGVVRMYHDAFQAGAIGSCVFEFIDEWWKNHNHSQDHMIQEPHDPEEWFGIAYFDEAGEFYTRPVFHALKDYNQAIVREPREFSVVKKKTTVQVYVESDIRGVEARFNGTGKWVPLKRESPHWFRKQLSVKKLKNGKHTLEVRAIGPDQESPEDQGKSKEYLRSQTFYVNNDGKLRMPQKIRILLDQDVYYTENRIYPIRTRYEVTDALGKPVPDVDVAIAFYEPVLHQRLTFIKKTDENGIATHVYHVNEEGIVTVAAGILAYPEGSPSLEEDNSPFIFKSGDVRHIQIYYQKPGNEGA